MDPILMQDCSTSQASDSCADDTDMRRIMLTSTISADGGSAGSIENGICNARAARYLLFISRSHAKVFCVYSWVIGWFTIGLVRANRVAIIARQSHF
jgi:hypothetical protein